MLLSMTTFGSTAVLKIISLVFLLKCQNVVSFTEYVLLWFREKHISMRLVFIDILVAYLSLYITDVALEDVIEGHSCGHSHYIRKACEANIGGCSIGSLANNAILSEKIQEHSCPINSSQH